VTPVSVAAASPDQLARAFARERIRSAHLINLIRLWGVSAFFALFLLLGGVLGTAGWTGNFGLFATYWSITAGVFLWSWRFERAASLSFLAIAFLDMPMVFLLQEATLATSPSASGVAGFTVGVYVLLVVLATLSLKDWYILLAAAVGSAFEVLLQYLAGVGAGGMLSTFIVLGLTATACSYARRRLVELVVRIDRDVAEQRRAEIALHHARRMETLATLGRDLSATLDLAARTAALFRWDETSRRLVCVAASGSVPRSSSDGLALAETTGAAGRAVVERRPVAMSDVLADRDGSLTPELRDRLVDGDHRAVCAVPLLVRDTVVGALEIGDTAGRVFSAEQLQLVQSFADHASLSLENARLYAELEARLRQVETAQTQVLQAGKLAAVGQLVSGVAHELNNPLMVISGHAQLLRRRVSDPEHVRRVDAIQDSAMRAAKIVDDLQTVVRPRSRAVGPVDLRDLVTRVLGWRDNAFRVTGIALACDFPPRRPGVLGDAAQLEQVFLNLILNAEQALVGCGAPRIDVTVSQDDGWVRVKIADTGPGIPPDVLPRIFEPFFSTKPVGQGTGLGLTICYSIVQSHGGRLTAESAPGAGTRMVVELPAHDGEPAATPEAAGPAFPALRRGHILVVDDEEFVAGVLRDLLGDLQVEATVVRDGEAAWTTLTTSRQAFDAVMLDLRMPGLSGRQLHERLERRMPEVASRVIFVTGDTVDPESQGFLGRTGRPVVTKPFALESLVAALVPFLGPAEGARPAV
jgi:signal transduction histidine kinase/CheY-like chemotaxis protein